MAITEAIILAGGLGTRLRHAVPDLPKCLAPIGGKPFLYYVIRHFQAQGIQKFIFATGYKGSMVEEYLDSWTDLDNWEISEEEEPLGTGGAIKLACGRTATDNVLVLNGDTLFRIDLGKFFNFHLDKRALCSLALKPMKDFDRYGAVSVNADESVESFLEKKFCARGLINGGVYGLRVGDFIAMPLPDKFSFENDFLQTSVDRAPIFGQVQDAYFIDIGIPDDLERAQRDLPILLNQ